MQVVEVEILGRRFAIRSERAPEHLEQVAAVVDRRLRELCAGAPMQREHGILLALNLASELTLLKEERDTLLDALAQDVDAAIGQIEPLLPPATP
jgi:cell division protein ZapA (FtsZ GTPase activity inhibitor)